MAAQLDLFYLSGTLRTAAQIVDSAAHSAKYSSSVLRAPLPVAGPSGRLYLTHSKRVFVDANLYGMYFFGYDAFISRLGDSWGKRE
jgi:hypothetical protein